MASALTQSPAWQALAAHARLNAGLHLRELFARDPERGLRLTLEFDEIYLDYSKQRVTDETMALLFALSRQADVGGWIRRMFAGESINNSENRAVLHVALRSDRDEFPPGRSIMREVREARRRMREFVALGRSGGLRGATGKPIREVVNLGVGGSDLGPRMLARALRPHAMDALRVHFVANVDPADLDEALAGLDPEATYFILASKTFTTVETLDNARRAVAWVARATGKRNALRHFAAATANLQAALDFGVSAERVFPIWDWVGGRFSIWSSIALAAGLALGNEALDGIAEGARQMDAHFHTAPPESSMPVILALLSIWNVNFLGAQSHAVLPYSEALRDFPAYLQQLEMESNGKRVDRDGREVDYATAPVIWGATGSTSQHSFHQLLHQGTPLVPVDFIVASRGEGDAQAHALLLANALAQGATLASGTAPGEPAHAVCPGNKPSSTLLIERLSPPALGQLIALYEHKIFVQGAIWNLNSFDQWGVEYGKKLARSIASEARNAPPDSSTAALLKRARRP